jgi:hypothetical protein
MGLKLLLTAGLAGEIRRGRRRRYLTFGGCCRYLRDPGHRPRAVA